MHIDSIYNISLVMISLQERIAKLEKKEAEGLSMDPPEKLTPEEMFELKSARAMCLMGSAEICKMTNLINNNS